MTEPLILSERRGGVLVVTLNRPDVLNSFSAKMALELQNVLRGAKDHEVRAVLLTGNGRGFCAGQDLSEVAPRPDGSLPDLAPIVRDHYNPIIKLIRTLEKPVVCAVNGIAAGAGANLALSCDIVIAAEEASFIQSFSKVGLIPDSGGTFSLPRLVGLGKAAALMMLAEKVSAKDAVAMGMIYRAVPGESLLTEAGAIAESLSKMPTRGLWFTKQLLNQSYGSTLDEQLAREEELQRAAGATDDYREGVVSFLEKRKPEFFGR